MMAQLALTFQVIYLFLREEALPQGRMLILLGREVAYFSRRLPPFTGTCCFRLQDRIVTCDIICKI
jgi:hypothetical protein